MRKETQASHTALLCVCGLSQLVIGTAQPSGLPAGVLILLFALSTLVQAGMFRMLHGRRLLASRFFLWLFAVLLLFAVGYDVVRADRFYRAVTSESFSFQWLMVSMLLLGWYASRCGRDTLLRAAQPVLALLLISLAVLGVRGNYRLEGLLFVQPDSSLLPDAARAFLEFTFGAELLIWLYWQECPVSAAAADKNISAQTARIDPAKTAGWPALLWLRFAVASCFALLGELALGARAQQQPQLFGALSLISAGADSGHGGVMYHCVWLAALTLRVCALCCTLFELEKMLFRQKKTPVYFLVLMLPAAAAAVFWAALWRQNCQSWLAGAVLVLAAGIMFFVKRGGRNCANRKKA